MLLSCHIARLDPTKSVHFTPTFQRDRHIELERSFMFETFSSSRRSFPGFSLETNFLCSLETYHWMVLLDRSKKHCHWCF